MTELATNPPQELRPRKGSFIFPRIVGAVIAFGILGAGLSVGLYLGVNEAAALAGPLLFLAGTAFVYWTGLVAYRKERYEIHPTHLRCRKGGVTSDETTELTVRNITHVKLRLPWLRYKFFKVGDVLIESAGSGGSEIQLRSVRNPERIYDQMRRLMQENGYALEQQILLHEETPDLIGVLVECASLFVGACVALLFTIGEFLADKDIDLEVKGMILGGLGLLGVMVGFVALVVHFLDMRRRTYRVFEDTVVYEEGFLTRENAFIPYENIADANSKRTLLDQVLGLYDVQVSCQGSGSEIKFRRLRRGEEMTAAVEKLVELARTKPKPGAEQAASEAKSSAPALGLPEVSEPDLPPPTEAWTAELRMNSARAVVPLLPMFPVFPVWLAASVQALVQASATQFSVRPSSVKSSYKFLSTNEREFAYDKITGVVVKENPWDRLFGTVTVRLWSIGASQPLDLAHVKRKQVNVKALLRQIGIPAASPEPYEVTTAFGLGAWLRGRLPGVVALTAIAITFVALALLVHEAFFIGLGILGLSTAAGLLYARALYSKQRLSFHDHHVQAEIGLLWRSRYHARYSNIKKVQLTRYPGCDQGSVKIFVAGERRVAQQKQGFGQAGKEGKQTGAVLPYAFTAHFVTEMTRKLTLVDDILLRRTTPSPDPVPAAPLETIMEGRRSVGNSVFIYLTLFVLILPLIVLLPFVIPFTVISVKRWRYRVEAGRVVASWGILFHHQTSILFNRIDSLRNAQGLVNKIFKNGAVTLLTAGSSAPDLILADLPEYMPFYEEIRRHYGKRDA